MLILQIQIWKCISFNLLKNIHLDSSIYYVWLLFFKICKLVKNCPKLYTNSNIPNFQIGNVPNFEVGNVPNFEVGNVPNFKLGNCIQSIITRGGAPP